MPTIPSAPVIAGAVLGGYVAGRSTGNRALAGVTLAAGLAAATPRWAARSPLLALGLVGATVALVGVSHPLSHRIGPWPAVLTTTAAAAALAALGDGFAAHSS